MASSSVIPSIERWEQWLPHPTVQPLPYIVTSFLVMIAMITFGSSKTKSNNVPILNPIKSFSLTSTKAKKGFLTSSRELIAKANASYPGKPYRLFTDLGELTVLPHDLADEIRNESRLDFTKGTFKDFHGTIPGFQGLAPSLQDTRLLLNVARKQLTKSLAKVAEPISEEAAIAMSVNLGDSPDWRKIRARPAILDIISRLSSRVFLGDELCRNEEWLRITKSYTVNVFSAADTLRMFPKVLRPLVHWFLPECKTVRAQHREAQRTIAPVIEKRRQLRNEAASKGQPVPQFNDALDWAEEEAKSSYDPANFQLNLSVAAIHTSSDLLQQFVLDLAENPKYFEPLREEVIRILRAEGWKKSALYNMKLLDSAIKETQRMKPIGITSMRRLVVQDMQLSNGLTLKAGGRVAVDSTGMWSSDMYENPEAWNPYRFLDLRTQPGKENTAILVSTSASHLGFGHGEHACPGRFFAANEIKIAICHMLIKYDWKLAPGTDAKPSCSGLSLSANPNTEILVRRRKTMEIDIDSL